MCSSFHFHKNQLHLNCHQTPTSCFHFISRPPSPSFHHPLLPLVPLQHPGQGPTQHLTLAQQQQLKPSTRSCSRASFAVSSVPWWVLWAKARMTRRASPSSCRGCRSQPTFSSVPRNQRVSNNPHLLIISDTDSFICMLSPSWLFCFFCIVGPGFFGELLMLVCQTFTMSDLVMLLHGQHQPLSRIQPQLAQFFNQNYLNGREPTDQNIAVCITHQNLYYSLNVVGNFRGTLQEVRAVLRHNISLIFVGCFYFLWTFSVIDVFFPSACCLLFLSQAAADSLVNELEEYITESFVSPALTLFL